MNLGGSVDLSTPSSPISAFDSAHIWILMRHNAYHVPSNIIHQSLACAVFSCGTPSTSLGKYRRVIRS